MSKINVNNMDESKKLTAETMSQVKGGPAYIKFEGVDGECSDSSTPPRRTKFSNITLKRG